MTKIIRTVSVLAYLMFIGAVWLASPEGITDKALYTLYATLALGINLYLAEIFNQPKDNKDIPSRPKSPTPILDVTCSTDVRARTHRRRRHESSLGNLGMLDNDDWPTVRQSPSIHRTNDPDISIGSDSSSSSSSSFSSSSYDSGSSSGGSSSGGGCD